jgi:hypothetical protein
MSLLTEHAQHIGRMLNYIQCIKPEESKRLCWAVTQGEFDALAREIQEFPYETLPLRNMHIAGIRVVVVENLGELVLR